MKKKQQSNLTRRLGPERGTGREKADYEETNGAQKSKMGEK